MDKEDVCVVVSHNGILLNQKKKKKNEIDITLYFNYNGIKIKSLV